MVAIGQDTAFGRPRRNRGRALPHVARRRVLRMQHRSGATRLQPARGKYDFRVSLLCQCTANQRNVGSTKCKRVGHCRSQRGDGAGRSRDVVEITLRIGMHQVQRWRKYALFDRSTVAAAQCQRATDARAWIGRAVGNAYAGTKPVDRGSLRRIVRHRCGPARLTPARRRR